MTVLLSPVPTVMLVLNFCRIEAFFFGQFDGNAVFSLSYDADIVVRQVVVAAPPVISMVSPTLTLTLPSCRRRQSHGRRKRLCPSVL